MAPLNVCPEPPKNRVTYIWLQWKENRKKADFYTVSSLFFSSKPSCQAAATHPVRKYSLYFRLNWLTHSLSLSHASRLSVNPPRRCSNNNLSKMFGNWLWIAALLGTHMLEGVMGHRQCPRLLQVVIPVEVWHILSRVTIWNTRTPIHLIWIICFPEHFILFISNSC